MRTIRSLALSLAAAMLCLATPASASMPGADFAHEANRLCREILNTRPYGVVYEGASAGVETLAAFLGHKPLAEAELEATRQALMLRRDEFLRSHALLAELTPPSALETEWQLFLDHLTAEAALSQSRLDWIDKKQEPFEMASDILPDSRRLQAAHLQMGFTGRDCEMIAREPGVPDDWRPFVKEMAAICTRIVDRRAANGFDDDRTIAFDAFAAAFRGNLTLPRPGLEAAHARLGAEWDRQLHDLAAIPQDIVPAPAAFAEYKSHFREVAAVNTARLELIRSQPDKPSQAYKALPGTPILNVTLESLHLDTTDCRSISS